MTTRWFRKLTACELPPPVRFICKTFTALQLLKIQCFIGQKLHHIFLITGDYNNLSRDRMWIQYLRIIFSHCNTLTCLTTLQRKPGIKAALILKPISQLQLTNLLTVMSSNPMEINVPSETWKHRYQIKHSASRDVDAERPRSTYRCLRQIARNERRAANLNSAHFFIT